MLNTHTFIDEFLREFEDTYGPRRVPLPPSVQPELEDTALLDERQHRAYMHMVGKVPWLCSLGKLYLQFSRSVLNHSTLLKAKHVSIAWHYVRAAIAAGIVSPRKVWSAANPSDL